MDSAKYIGLDLHKESKRPVEAVWTECGWAKMMAFVDRRSCPQRWNHGHFGTIHTSEG
jgi:hypothetical protein